MRGMIGRPLQRIVRNLIHVLATVCAFCIAGVVVLVSPAVAQDQPGMSLSQNFPGNAKVVMTAGSSTEQSQVMHVGNLGPSTAEVATEQTAPAGIDVNWLNPAKTIEPGQTIDFTFGITVAKQVAPGTYPIIATVKQTNVPTVPGKTVYAPGVSAQMRIVVTGDGAHVNVTAIDANGGGPIEGQLTLAAYEDDEQGLVLAETKGSKISKDVAPGRYIARFQLQGVSDKEVPFDVKANETKNIQIKVETVAFTIVAARPVPNPNKVASAKVTAIVSNQVTPVKGPVKIVMDVSLNGEHLETVDLKTVGTLPKGNTEAHETYVPEQGWKYGSYGFNFKLVAPDFTIQKQADGFTKARPWWMFALAALALLLFLWWLIAWRRRKRDEEEVPAQGPPEPPAPINV